MTLIRCNYCGGLSDAAESPFLAVVVSTVRPSNGFRVSKGAVVGHLCAPCTDQMLAAYKMGPKGTA